MFLFIIGILSYSGSDVIDNGPVSPALSEPCLRSQNSLWLERDGYVSAVLCINKWKCALLGYILSSY